MLVKFPRNFFHKIFALTVANCRIKSQFWGNQNFWKEPISSSLRTIPSVSEMLAPSWWSLVERFVFVNTSNISLVSCKYLLFRFAKLILMPEYNCSGTNCSSTTMHSLFVSWLAMLFLKNLIHLPLDLLLQPRLQEVDADHHGRLRDTCPELTQQSQACPWPASTTLSMVESRKIWRRWRKFFTEI